MNAVVVNGTAKSSDNAAIADIMLYPSDLYNFHHPPAPRACEKSGGGGGRHEA